jgi:uncharacterized membrane protein
MTPDQPSPPPAQKKRIQFIDLLRGWAVIVMIETHVVNATITDAIRATAAFDVLQFINGLVAPAFLFASGMAFAITTRRKVQDYLSFGMPFFRQIGRLALILVVGYVLHIPKFEYEHLLHETKPEAWLHFFQVDVLQCIAVSIILLQLLLLGVRTERRLYLVTALMTVAIVAGTPLVWQIDFSGMLAAPLAAYMNAQNGSLFPLFPWAAFLFAGAIAGYAYLEHAQRNAGEPGGRSYAQTAASAGVIMIVASFLLHPVGVTIYPVYDYWHTSPSFYLLRLGIVMLLCAGMFLYETRHGVRQSSPVTLIGRQSLIVYVVHLMLVYGRLGGESFNDRVGRSFGYAEAMVTALILFALMYLLALAWERIKRGPAPARYALEGIVLAAFLYVFFFVRWG